MKVYGNIPTAGILFFSLFTLAIPGGCGGTTFTRRVHSRPRRSSGRGKNCMQRIVDKININEHINNSSELDFKGICRDSQEIKNCIVKHLKAVHNCGTQQTGMILTLLENMVNYACEDNGKILAGLFPEDNLMCFTLFHKDLSKCNTPARKSESSLDSIEKGTNCNKSGTEAELYICKFFFNVPWCFANILKECQHPSPYNTLTKIIDHTINSTFCAKHQHQLFGKTNGQESGDAATVKEVTCEGKSCQRTFASPSSGSGVASISDTGPSAPQVVSEKAEEVQPLGSERNPVFTSRNISSETLLTKNLSDRPAETQTVTKFGESEWRTGKSEAPFLELKVFNLLLQLILIMLLYIK